MTSQFSQSDLKSLLSSIEEVQYKILQTRGQSDEIKKRWAAELEPLPNIFLVALELVYILLSNCG